MFEIVFESDAKKFLDKYGDWLRKRYVEHNLIMGLCNKAIEGKYPVIHCIAVLNNGEPSLLAIQTPPHHLLLSETSGDGMEEFVKELVNDNFVFPGILGPTKIVEEFADLWFEATNKKFVKGKANLIYVLEEVSFPECSVEGEFSLAKEKDLDLLAKWLHAISLEALPEEDYINEEEAIKRVKSLIAEGKIGVWKVDGEPVSCSKFQAFDDMARIGFVYTPPELRGKGYASAGVASLSQYVLDKGVKKCCLYTDAGNPTSNSIYTKMGYKLVTDAVLYLAEKRA